MRYLIYFAGCIALITLPLSAQDSVVIHGTSTLQLDKLITEVLASNRAIRTAHEQMLLMDTRVGQETALEAPELTYRRKEMPGFRWGGALTSEWEIMQTVQFPTKYSKRGELAEAAADHAHHLHMEVTNDVIMKLKDTYAELWFFQQNIVLERENLRLLDRLKNIAKSRYSVGMAPQNEVLMAELLRTRSENAIIGLRQAELGIKARLAAILDRPPTDTLGYAVIPEAVRFGPSSVETLTRMALESRPAVIHDSMMVEEGKIFKDLSRQEYLPDLKIGLSYMDGISREFSGWSISAGISLPFAPWSIARAGNRVDEAEASIRRAQEMYEGTKNDVIAEVRELYEKTAGLVTRLENFRTAILPTAELALLSGLSVYENGKTDYPMVHEAYLGFVEARREYYSTRLEYEKAVAGLERAVGSTNIF